MKFLELLKVGNNNNYEINLENYWLFKNYRFLKPINFNKLKEEYYVEEKEKFF